jgi:predicted metal-binding membrane protein
MRARSRPDLFLPLLIALVAAAWGVIWLLERGPYARYLHAADWSRGGLLGELCSAVPGGTVLVPAFAHAGAWTLMIVAMMLPTTLLLVDVFRRATGHRADHRGLLAWLLAGYLAVWGVFGLAVHVLDAAVHALVWRSGWLVAHAGVVGAATLVLAGAYQFSALKYRCLDKCRSPLLFFAEYWRGRDARRDSFALGAAHGLFCIGCCWALMLLMFAVGVGSIGWMLALAAVMAAEKNMPWGRRLAAPLGVVLLAWGAGLMLAV